MEGRLPSSHGRILIVDSYRASLVALQALLIGEGYLVETARCCAEGLALALAVLPDVVLTELSTREMIGIRLWHELSPDLPVIVVTAWVDAASATDALRAGARDYLTKPLDFPALLLCIERATRPRFAIALASVGPAARLRASAGM